MRKDVREFIRRLEGEGSASSRLLGTEFGEDVPGIGGLARGFPVSALDVVADSGSPWTRWS
jgi:hypothetical protein